MSKLCLYFNCAPHYRSAIYCQIDKEFDCDWYFGYPKDDIKEMDISLLKRVRRYHTFGNPKVLYWTCSLVPLLFKKEYNTFFIISESRSITYLLFLCLASIFYPKKRIYSWGHGLYGKETNIERRIKVYQALRTTGLFVYGQHSKELLTKCGIPSGKIYVIKNSLDYSLHLSIREKMNSTSIYSDHFNNQYKTIIFIGRLTKEKRLDMLVDAVSILRGRGFCSNLVIVGDGEQKPFLQQLVEEKGLNKAVWFYGPSYDEHINAELIYNAELCVSPGNVGLTAIHSMMFGTPVITHNCLSRQMPEFECIKPKYTGDFFEYDNISSLANSIAEWLTSNNGNRESVRIACYKEVDTCWNPNYQIDVICNNMLVE